MQISKACHLCMTNNKNNVKLFYWPFVCISCTSGEDLKKKTHFTKILAECVWNEKYSQTHTTPYIYVKNTVKYTDSLSASSFFTCGVSVFKTHDVRESLSSTKDDFSRVCSCINKCRKLEHMINRKAITTRMNHTIKGAIFAPNWFVNIMTMNCFQIQTDLLLLGQTG